MRKTKILTKQLQEEQLNILDALKLSDKIAMDAELDVIFQFRDTMGIDSMGEYQIHHRPR